ncbi:hypothetical protein ELB75_08445 [Eikenella corrodens]|uniref:Uncharacterized protein n=1 Tax=Eikenella corrodens TaxID=539 RepID=A0A3S9SKN3_EIKCO|nr:hypothetical protein ELB75_08445 [Eikenella corrodens]
MPIGFQVASTIRQRLPEKYSGLNLNQYSVVSPCRNVCTVCGSPPCPDLNLIHYTSTPPPVRFSQSPPPRNPRPYLARRTSRSA